MWNNNVKSSCLRELVVSNFFAVAVCVVHRTVTEVIYRDSHTVLASNHFFIILSNRMINVSSGWAYYYRYAQNENDMVKIIMIMRMPAIVIRFSVCTVHWPYINANKTDKTPANVLILLHQLLRLFTFSHWIMYLYSYNSAHKYNGSLFPFYCAYASEWATRHAFVDRTN